MLHGGDIQRPKAGATQWRSRWSWQGARGRNEGGGVAEARGGGAAWQAPQKQTAGDRGGRGAQRWRSKRAQWGCTRRGAPTATRERTAHPGGPPGARLPHRGVSTPESESREREGAGSARGSRTGWISILGRGSTAGGRGRTSGQGGGGRVARRSSKTRESRGPGGAEVGQAAAGRRAGLGWATEAGGRTPRKARGEQSGSHPSGRARAIREQGAAAAGQAAVERREEWGWATGAAGRAPRDEWGGQGGFHHSGRL